MRGDVRKEKKKERQDLCKEERNGKEKLRLANTGENRFSE